MAKQNLIYVPFNNDNSEKLEIEDFKIISSPTEEVSLLVHRLKKELDNGDIVHYYKATKFFRLVRTSKESKDNKKLLNIHSDIVRGLYQAHVNFVQIVCNILQTDETVDAWGLLFYYGVQTVAATEEEAVRHCEEDFQSLLRSFQATHRTAHIQRPTYKEVFWVFKKLREQTHVSVVKGIPAPKVSSSQSKNVIKTETSTDDQMEQFLSGLITDEYLMLLMCTPIEQSTLRGWLTKSMKDQTKWESQKQGSTSFNMGVSVPMTMSLSGNQSLGISSNKGSSINSSTGNSWGTSASTSTSQSSSVSLSTSRSVSTSEGVSTSDGTSSSFGTSSNTSNTVGTNHSESNTVGGTVSVTPFGLGASGNYSHNWTDGRSESTSNSTGTSTSAGTSHSSGTSSSLSQSLSESESRSTSMSESASRGITEGGSSSNSVGQSSGSGLSSSNGSGWGKSMGLAPSFSMGKTYQFTDITVAYICELLSTQNQRLKNMTEGEGGFFVDLYISCKDTKTQKAIQSLVVSTWENPDAKIDVLHAIIPDRKEQKKLSLHMQALTPCLEMGTNQVGRYYKWASVLQSSEISAYSHPPRISMGGIDNAMEDRPKMRVPTNRQNKEIFVGNVINGESFNIDQAAKHRGNGYLTDFKFTIGSNELHHAFLSGQSGSGKTVLALRLITGLYNKTFTIDKVTGQKKKKRVLILDPNGEWRQLGNVIPPGYFRFYSLSDPHFHPLRMNLLRVPRYIRASDYYTMIVEMFCSAYGLLDRAIAQIGSCIYELYESVGAFDNDFDPMYANERTKDITLEDVYKKLVEKKEISIAKRDNHDVEAISTYLTRLDAYAKPKSKEFIMFCERGGKSVDEVLGKDDVTVIESNGLAKAAQSFYFTLVMQSIFKYAQARGARGFYDVPDQYETFIVLEEANSVLVATGEKDDASREGLKKFEDLVNQSRKFGLFVWTLTQTIATMPKAVIANSGLIFAGKCSRRDDIDIIMAALGKEERYDDRDLYKFFPRMPVGEFIVKISKSESEIEQEACMVKVSPLNVDVPNNEELEVIIQENDMMRKELGMEDMSV